MSLKHKYAVYLLSILLEQKKNSFINRVSCLPVKHIFNCWHSKKRWDITVTHVHPLSVMVLYICASQFPTLGYKKKNAGTEELKTS